MIERAPRTDRYTVVPNAALEDTRLSFRARGVLAYVLSKPDHWKTNADHLTGAGTEGRDAVRKALTELEAAGYLTRRRVRGGDGKLSTVVTVHESPTPENRRAAPPAPMPENPSSVPPAETPAQTEGGLPVVGFSGLLVSTDELELKTLCASGAKTRNDLWDALVDAGLIGTGLTPSERSDVGKTVRELRAAGATPDQVHDRVRQWRRMFPSATLTHRVLRNRWTQLEGPSVRSAVWGSDMVPTA